MSITKARVTYIGICTNCAMPNDEKVCPHCGKLYRSATYTIDDLAEMLYISDSPSIDSTNEVCAIPYTMQSDDIRQQYIAKANRMIANNMPFPL